MISAGWVARRTRIALPLPVVRAGVVAVAVLATLGFGLGVLPAAAQPVADLTTSLDDSGCPSDSDGWTQFTVAATGDTFPHEKIQQVGETRGYDVLFDYLRPYVQAADLAYTNFDGAMLKGAGYTGYPAFNFNPALATALRNAGIDVVSTANNHILDRGPPGLDATLDVLAAAGLVQHGTVRRGVTDRPPYTRIELTRDDATVSIGFVSATWGTNGIPDPFNQVNLLYNSNDYGQQGGIRQGVLDAIAQADRETDLVLVAAHFGFEYRFTPDRTQVAAAQAMAESGADIILGAQPHTLQPPDVIDLGERQTWVFYSLGNFLAAQGRLQAKYYAATSAVIYIGLARDPEGRVSVTGYRYLPTIHVDNDTRPAPIAPGTADDVIAHVRTIMRDPAGAKQLPPDPPAAGTTIRLCPDAPVAASGAPAATPDATPRPSSTPSGTGVVASDDEQAAPTGVASSGRSPITWVALTGVVVLAGLILVILRRAHGGHRRR